MSAILECHSVSKVYGAGALSERVLKDVSMSVGHGEACVLLGPSGSGKTTLLSILGCLLSPTSGELSIDGQAIAFGSRSRLGRVRRTSIGFVFQHAQLLPFLNVQHNLEVTGRNSGIPQTDLKQRVDLLLEELEIAPLRRRKPHEISGGQRQRVAIARAVLHRPSVILADEPTAALDWQRAERVIELLVRQTRIRNAALIAVTHDTRLVDKFDRVLRIDDGNVSEDMA